MITAFNLTGQPVYLNTKTPYQPQQKNYAAPPKGYVPVFINYVGRHGSRFQTSPDKDLLVTTVLQQAKESNALTKEGFTIYKLVLFYQDIEKDNYGNITRLGMQEQHDIAERMQSQNSSVFSNGKLLVEMTEKLRTQQSATAFLSGLHYDTTNIESIIFPSNADSILRFYDLSKAYKIYADSAVKKHTDSLINDKRTVIAANDVWNKLFTKDFANNKINVTVKNKTQALNPVLFSQALYDVFASMFAASKELKSEYENAITAFNKIFSTNDLRWFDEINSASDFYEKGPGENASGIQITIATPLLNDLIKTTDAAIQQKKYNAILRFTHAEAISPLATLMEIPQASTTSNSVFKFYTNWNASAIIPMSANIQWIVYSNGSNYLLKILLNEKEVALPVKTTTFPYYNWNDIKLYYISKLSSITKN
ncbi:MAG TPA: histidine-type phosphatase [Parafilimonas sp.]|nr:histidine-type phosphatase [Parafilimonas sp.]